VACAEIGLTGELRPIHGLARRLREAARLGFSRAVVPRLQGRGEAVEDVAGIQVVRVATLREAIAASLAEPSDRRAPIGVGIPVSGGAS
jgi:DNA repair protein RadA/Sms